MRRQFKEVKHHRQEEAPEEAEPKVVDHDDLKHDLDEILDEIDSVLEENAEEFVKSYVQKGGE